MFNTSILLNPNSTPSTRTKSFYKPSSFSSRRAVAKQVGKPIFIGRSKAGDWEPLLNPVDNSEPMSEAEKNYWENL